MQSPIDEMIFRASVSPNEKTHRKRRHSDNDYSDDDSSSPKSHSPSIDDDRRAHHNELERRRRDHIKDHFMSLKDAIPLLEGEKSSRALILKRAVEYISVMQSRLTENQRSIEELRRRNELLEEKLNQRVEPSTSPIARVPIQPAPMPQLVLPTFKPALPAYTPQVQTVHTVPAIPESTSPVVPALDAVQLSSLIASNPESLLALTQALLGSVKVNPQPIQQRPEAINTSFLNNTFVLPDRQMTVRF